MTISPLLALQDFGKKVPPVSSQHVGEEQKVEGQEREVWSAGDLKHKEEPPFQFYL